jgi:hypothetical protein
MQSSGMLRCVALVRINVSGKPSAHIIRVTRIGELVIRIIFSVDRIWNT